VRSFDSFLSPWFIFHLGIYPNLLWAHFHTRVTYYWPNMVVWSGEYWTTFSIILPQFCVNFHSKISVDFLQLNQSHSSQILSICCYFPQSTLLRSICPFLFCPLAVLIVSLMNKLHSPKSWLLISWIQRWFRQFSWGYRVLRIWKLGTGRSKEHTVVTRSTTEAKYRAITEGVPDWSKIDYLKIYLFQCMNLWNSLVTLTAMQPKS